MGTESETAEKRPQARSAAKAHAWQTAKVTAIAIHPPAVSLALFYEWLDAWPAVAIGFAMSLVFGWLVYLLTLLLPISSSSRLLSTGAVVLAFWDGRVVTERLGLAWASLALVGLALVVAAIAHRLDHSGKTQFLANALVLFVVGLPIGQGVITAVAMGDVTVASTRDVKQARPVTDAEADVVVVIFDGYPSNASLSRDFAYANEELTQTLERTGFSVADFTWSAYPVTELSLGSALDLELKLGEGVRPTRGDVHALFRMLGGEATLFRAFASAGYSIHYVEGGWTASRCRVGGFTCYPAPAFGEFAVNLAVNSVAFPLLRPEDLPWISGTQRAKAVLDDVMDSIVNNGENELLFAHVIVPHEPWILDPACEVRAYTEDRDAFIGHLGCANAIMASIAAQAETADATVLFMADHGTSTRLQIGKPAAEWTDAEVRERLTAFAALRSAEPCASDLSTTIDAVGSLVTCTLEGVSNDDRRAVNILTATEEPIFPVSADRVARISRCLVADSLTADC